MTVFLDEIFDIAKLYQDGKITVHEFIARINEADDSKRRFKIPEEILAKVRSRSNESIS